jgi:hypothetical protein
MSDSPEWEAKFKSFLKKAQDDFKRAATDVKAEAERLMKEVQDPKTQEKMKSGVQEAGVWAKKTAEQLASLVEVGVKQAEGTLNEMKKQFTHPIETPADREPKDVAEPMPAPTPKNAAPPTMEPPAPPAPKPPAKKTVGRAATPKKSAPAKPAAKKSMGKKK